MLSPEILAPVVQLIGIVSAIFLAPLITKWLMAEYRNSEKDANESDILNNYSEALNSAWKRIQELEQQVHVLTAEKNAARDRYHQEIAELLQENQTLRRNREHS